MGALRNGISQWSSHSACQFSLLFLSGGLTGKAPSGQGKRRLDGNVRWKSAISRCPGLRCSGLGLPQVWLDSIDSGLSRSGHHSEFTHSLLPCTCQLHASWACSLQICGLESWWTIRSMLGIRSSHRYRLEGIFQNVSAPWSIWFPAKKARSFVSMIFVPYKIVRWTPVLVREFLFAAMESLLSS